jgi:hypothetical protein
VVAVLIEANENNPSGEYPILELWNFEKKRRATLHEGIQFLQNYERKRGNGQNYKPVKVPEAIIAIRTAFINGVPEEQVLVQWNNCQPYEVSWEDFEHFQSVFPSFDLGS